MRHELAASELPGQVHIGVEPARCAQRVLTASPHGVILMPGEPATAHAIFDKL
jgi:hypothetical protein